METKAMREKMKEGQREDETLGWEKRKKKTFSSDSNIFQKGSNKK